MEGIEKEEEAEMNFLEECERYLIEHQPDKTAEETFVQMEKVLTKHRLFNAYLEKNTPLIHTLHSMPKKADRVLARRKLFIFWYIERNKGRKQEEVVEELCDLIFASKTTIYSIIYDYRKNRR